MARETRLAEHYQEGSTASGAILTVIGSSARGVSIASKGEQCQWSMANTHNNNNNNNKKRRAWPGRALLAKGSNAKGALRSNARVRC